MSLTTDPSDPRLAVTEASGMQEAYLVLSDEERTKGFVRPVRRTYVHVGHMPDYLGVHQRLDPPYQGKYVAVMTRITNEDGSFKGGPYVTQEELDAWQIQTPIGGCGAVTTMNAAIAETYSRDPKFYGATFCVQCGKHLPVAEFVWEGTTERVGS